jgi:hypothetical protein
MPVHYIRRFRPAGLEHFRAYLSKLAATPAEPPPFDILDSPDLTELCGRMVNIEQRRLPTKRDAAAYLKDRLSRLGVAGASMHDSFLWSWLALFFFDSVCPEQNGRRKPKAAAHYILDSQNHQRRYRHLLATPYQILLEIPDHNRIYLDAPLDTHGEMIEQTMSKLYLMRVPAVREVIDKLYFDGNSGKPKRGLFPKREGAKPGDLRNRLPVRIQQLQKTYDISALDGQRLLSLLGAEFDRWLDAA